MPVSVYKMEKAIDSEGREWRTVGYYKVTDPIQIAENMVTKPDFNHSSLLYTRIVKVEITDLTSVKRKYVREVEVSSFGTIKLALESEHREELEQRKLVESAQSKLTEAELLALLKQAGSKI